MRTQKNIDIKSNNKSFGYLFSAIFFLIFLYQYINSSYINWIFIIISIIFLILGIVNSNILTPLKILWIKLGFFLGKIISPIILGFIFYFIVTPIALLLKIFRKDVLRLKKNKTSTYWIEKSKIKSEMKNQF